MVSFPHNERVVKTMINQEVKVMHCGAHSISITHNGQTFHSLYCQNVEPTESYEALIKTVYGPESLGNRL